MPINTNVTNEQITVSVGETQIDVSVNGGVGPTGNAGAAATVTVGTVTTGAPGSSATVVNAGSSSAAVLNFTIPAGTTGATGPQGPQGPAGTTTWAGITDKPTTFPPSAHQHVAADISDFTTAVIAAAPPTTNASLLVQGTLPDARLSGNIARTSDVSSAVAALVNSAPATLDTLAELASALGSDANFSTTVTNALAAKAPINNPTFTGTVSGITKAMVGLSNADNTSDASKPVSTAQAAADAAVASAAAADATSKANAAQAAAVQRANHTGTQAIGTVTGLQAALDGKAASSHAHGNITTDGKIGSVAGKAIVTGENGALEAANYVPQARALYDVANDESVFEFLDSTPVWSSFATTNDVPTQFRESIGAAAVSHAHTVADISGLATVATSGSAADLTGTLSASRLPSTTVTAGSYGSASSVATLTVDAAGRLTAAGSTAIAISASQITSGTVAAARLGSGTASSSTFLRGDQTYAAPPVTSVDGITGAVTVTKAEIFEFTRTSKPASATGSNGNYSWSLPANAKLVEVLMIGGGGGGGSGRRGAPGTMRYGGGGGGSASTIHTTFMASLVTTPIAVVVGGGGTGGAAVSADDTNGNSGTSGGSSTLTFNGSPAACLTGLFGFGASGGTGTSGTGGTFVSNGISTFRGNAGQSAAISNLPSYPNQIAANGNIVISGTAGGSIDAANVVWSPGTLDPQATLFATAAQVGASVTGGAASATGGAAGAGGVSYGYGGCGGGATANGSASGAGGNGGSGYVRITIWS